MLTCFHWCKKARRQRDRAWSGLREICSSIILNVVTDAPLILSVCWKRPALPPRGSVPLPLLPIRRTILLFCFSWGEKRLEVNGYAGVLNFKPNKISDSPQSWTSKLVASLWEELLFLVLRASFVSACVSGVSPRVLTYAQIEFSKPQLCCLKKKTVQHTFNLKTIWFEGN